MRSLARSLLLRGLILSSLLWLLTTHIAFAITKHGCASPIPSAVPGPLFQPAATQGSLYINEVLLTPHSTWNCSELGVYTATNDTWVELYNPQSQPLDLYAVHASIDSGPNTNVFYLPFGSAIAAHGYLVVFPRTDMSFVATETSTWRLLISGTPIDEVKTPSLGEDQSYARIPDGSSVWQITTAPTIDTSNALILATPTKTTGGSSGTGTGTGIGGVVGSTGTGQGSGRSGGGISNTGSQTQGQQVDGHQPSWHALQFSTPTVMSSLPGPVGSTPTFTPSPSSPTMDMPRKIVLTVLVFVLALALVWCWRLFFYPSHRRSNMVSSTKSAES